MSSKGGKKPAAAKKNQRYFKNEGKAAGPPAPSKEDAKEVKKIVEEKEKQEKKNNKVNKEKKKLEEEKEETEEQEQQSESSDSESSAEDDSDSDFEAIKKEEGGSSRYRMALALRDTFQNFRNLETEDGNEEDSDEEDGNEGEEEPMETEKKTEQKRKRSKKDSTESNKQIPQKKPKNTHMAQKDFIALGEVKEEIKEEEQEKKPATKQRAKKPTSTNGAIYLGHIPHGFYEKEMKGFFSQFGQVTKVRLSRSKKTGRSKGYAFIEFKHKEVAEIVAETMNGYLLFGHILKCQVLPPERQHPKMWKGANREFTQIPWRKKDIRRRNMEKTPKQHQRHVNKLLKQEKAKKQKLKELGIDYDFPGYAASVPVKAKHVVFD